MLKFRMLFRKRASPPKGRKIVIPNPVPRFVREWSRFERSCRARDLLLQRPSDAGRKDARRERA